MKLVTLTTESGPAPPLPTTKKKPYFVIINFKNP